MRRIASRRNAIVSRYREAARGDADGVMLLDGIHLVQEALAAGITIREAAFSAEAIDDDRDLAARLDAAGVETTAVTAPVLAALSPVRSPSPIVALADRPSRGASVFGPPTALVVVAVDVQDPGNLGAIVRVAEAAGATGVIAAGRSADPFGWKALRGSMGSALRLPILVRKGPYTVSEFGRESTRVLATVPRGGLAPSALDLTGPVAILIGGEGPGLPAAALADADGRITLPMKPPVESLNAAVTAALIVYEAQRQRS
jgi:RNA methyltransferase, TrmH family